MLNNIIFGSDANLTLNSCPALKDAEASTFTVIMPPNSTYSQGVIDLSSCIPMNVFCQCGISSESECLANIPTNLTHTGVFISVNCPNIGNQTLGICLDLNAECLSSKITNFDVLYATYQANGTIIPAKSILVDSKYNVKNNMKYVASVFGVENYYSFFSSIDSIKPITSSSTSIVIQYSLNLFFLLFIVLA